MLIASFLTPDPFYAQVVRGVEDVLRRKQYALLLGQTYNRADEQGRYIAAFRARRVDGLLVFQAPGSDPELEKLVAAKTPLVYVGRQPEQRNADVVTTDIELGTRLAVDHLVEKGHRRIGMITIRGSLSIKTDRLRGWRGVLEASGITVDEELNQECDLSTESGKEAVLGLLQLTDRPTAIFVDNLLVLVAALEAVQENGLSCPDDLELMSSDDAEWLDVFRPAISTIVQPGYELGVKSAETLLQRIRHPNRKLQNIVLKPEIRIRSAFTRRSAG